MVVWEIDEKMKSWVGEGHRGEGGRDTVREREEMGTGREEEWMRGGEEGVVIRVLDVDGLATALGG